MSTTVDRNAPAREGLLHASGTRLAQLIREREVTSREVIETHIERLESFQPRTRAVVAERYELARAEADAADARVAEATDAGALAGEAPFLGVPCTIKEAFALTGMPNCSGLVSRREHIADTDATGVARLRAAGAIPLAVTNTSELCMWMESDNRVYGRTSSPYGRGRTAGGSSGGEGAAVGSGGSPFGLAADIGGSIRFPAYFNGVFGHKPTAGLIPNTGQFPIAEEESALRLLATGPVARRAEDLMGLVRVLAGPDGEDPSCVEMELGDPDAVSIEGLRVVVVQGDGVVPVSRRVAGAVQRAAGALQALGADVRNERVPAFGRALNLWSAEVMAEEAGQFATMLGGDGGEPVTFRRALGMRLRGRPPHTDASLFLLALEPANRMTPQRVVERRRELAAKLRRELAELIGDGVLLYPPYPLVAPRHNVPLLTALGVGYMAVFNVAGTPVTQTPVGLDDRGLPMGVQVVGRPGADHVTIAVARALAGALGGWMDPAGVGG